MQARTISSLAGRSLRRAIPRMQSDESSTSWRVRLNFFSLFPKDPILIALRRSTDPNLGRTFLRLGQIQPIRKLTWHDPILRQAIAQVQSREPRHPQTAA